ncbi:MAG: non-ribosomal peptide synthetase, partial [bacterium]|nr:non-ribosomal peptide synthetase [bacterium]
PNGKIDKKRLPEPEIKVSTEYVAPGNEMEMRIAEVWKKTLRIDKVGIHDNFFDMGGNSLDFIKINSELREDLKIEVPVVSMFRYPTIHTFVQYLNRDGYNRVIDRSQQEEKGKNRLQRLRNRNKKRV